MTKHIFYLALLALAISACDKTNPGPILPTDEHYKIHINNEFNELQGRYAIWLSDDEGTVRAFRWALGSDTSQIEVPDSKEGQAIRGQLPPAVRERAVFVLVSFDVVRDTPAALARYRAQRQLDSQWYLLHGDDDAVRELAALLGVKYKQEADGAFSHSNILTILNPAGEIVHQRAGLQGGLDTAAAALVAAAK